MKPQLEMLHILDRFNADLSTLRAQHIPASGWLRTVRRAVGLSIPTVAEAEGISHQSVSAFEAREALGTIQTGKLASLADILGCQLQYGVNSFRPEIQQRAVEVAQRRGGALPSEDSELPLPQYMEKSGMPRGGWLKRVRWTLGYSRAEVAAKAGISPSALQNLERTEARAAITLNSLRKVAAAMDCELIYFLSNSGKIAPTFSERIGAKQG